jgi:hypothetical protein
MSKVLVLASLVALNSTNPPEQGLRSYQAEPQDIPYIALNSFGPTKVADSAIENAVELLREARKAIQLNERRNRMKPGVDEKVVKKEKAKTEKREVSDKTLILGGKEAFPM